MKLKLIISFFILSFQAYSQNLKPTSDNSQYKIGAKINDTLSIAYTLKGDKFGVVMNNGRFIIPLKSQRLEYVNKVLIITIGKKQGILSPEGKIITPVKYDLVGARQHNRFLLRLNDEYGLIDNTNKFILPLDYAHIDYAGVGSGQNDNYYTVRNKAGLSGIYDYNGQQIISEKYVFYSIDKEKIFCTDEGKPMVLNYRDTSKNIILPPDITLIETFPHYCWSERYNQVFKKNGKFGLITSDNDILIPPIYDEIKNIFCGHNFVVKQNNKYGVVSYKNDLLKEIKYDSYFWRKEIVEFKRKDKKTEYFSVVNVE